MLKKLVVAACALSAAATAVPAAQASGAEGDCFAVVARAGAGAYEGVAVGFVNGGINSVSIRCVIYVGGTPVSGTEPGSGISVAVTAGRVSFDSYSNSEVCAEYWIGSSPHRTCRPTTVSPLP